MTGSYDPATGLVYWGTSQPKPHNRDARGTAGDALYSNSTLALDAATGELRWYYQHIPGDSHDMDESFERILIDYDGRRSLFTMGRLRILWELDRVTGRCSSRAAIWIVVLFEHSTSPGARVESRVHVANRMGGPTAQRRCAPTSVPLRRNPCSTSPECVFHFTEMRTVSSAGPTRGPVHVPDGRKRGHKE